MGRRRFFWMLGLATLVAIGLGVALPQLPLWVSLSDSTVAEVEGSTSAANFAPNQVDSERSAPVAARAALPAPPLPAPQVSGDRLMQHVNALSTPRVQAAERDRARTYLKTVLTQSRAQVTEQAITGGANLVADWPGTDPKAGMVLVGAHYDTVPNSPGADDNATGAATLLEVGRLLGDRPTPRTLRLVFFDLEEIGLVGSTAYTEVPTNLKNLRAALILDMIGYACYTAGCQTYPENLPLTPPSAQGNFLAVIGLQEAPDLLSAFHGKAQTMRLSGLLNIESSSQPGLPIVVTLPVPLKGVLTPDVLRSDHAPFWMKNIPAVMITDTANFRNPHYHRSSDLPSTLNADFFRGSAQLVVNATLKLLSD